MREKKAPQTNTIPNGDILETQTIGGSCLIRYQDIIQMHSNMAQRQIIKQYTDESSEISPHPDEWGSPVNK